MSLQVITLSSSACNKSPIYLFLLKSVADLKRLEKSARDGPSDPYSLAKWRILNRLHDRNETMYYKVSIKVQCDDIYLWQCHIYLLEFLCFELVQESKC